MFGMLVDYLWEVEIVVNIVFEDEEYFVSDLLYYIYKLYGSCLYSGVLCL